MKINSSHYTEDCKCVFLADGDFIQCERCKCIEVDDHFEGIHTVYMFAHGKAYCDSDGNLINFKVEELQTTKPPHICDNCPDCGIKEGE